MNDVEKKIENLKAEFLGKLEELQKEAEEQKERETLKPWKPMLGEDYFFINEGFATGYSVYNDDFTDDKFIKAGNCFPTGKRAEEVAEKMRLLLRLEQLHDVLCPGYEPDWGSGEAVYLLYYDHNSSCWAIDGWYDCNCHVNGVYFSNYENACKAAEILNKELENQNEKADC